MNVVMVPRGPPIGIWNADTLIVQTNQLKGWKGGLVEYTDNLETVEKYRRVGDRIEGEITLYDPEVLVRPVTAKLKPCGAPTGLPPAPGWPAW